MQRDELKSWEILTWKRSWKKFFPPLMSLLCQLFPIWSFSDTPPLFDQSPSFYCFFILKSSLMINSLTTYYGFRLSYQLQEIYPGKRFTFIVPTNLAWENVKRDFSTVFNSLTDLNNPDYVSFWRLRKLLYYARKIYIVRTTFLIL